MPACSAISMRDAMRDGDVHADLPLATEVQAPEPQYELSRPRRSCASCLVTSDYIALQVLRLDRSYLASRIFAWS